MMVYIDVEREAVLAAFRSGALGSQNVRGEAYITEAEHLIGVFSNETLLGVFGAQRPTLLGDIGFIWFAETAELCKHKVAFLRSVHFVPTRLFQLYDKLVGTSYDSRAVAWLTWLGAEFAAVLPGGGRPFIFRRPA